MELETVKETPVVELTIGCGTGNRDCSICASVLHGAQVGDVIIDEEMNSQLCGESVLVTVAHRTSRAVVLLIEQRGWTESHGHTERSRSTRLVAVELH